MSGSTSTPMLKPARPSTAGHPHAPAQAIIAAATPPMVPGLNMAHARGSASAPHPGAGASHTLPQLPSRPGSASFRDESAVHGAACSGMHGAGGGVHGAHGMAGGGASSMPGPGGGDAGAISPSGGGGRGASKWMSAAATYDENQRLRRELNRLRRANHDLRSEVKQKAPSLTQLGLMSVAYGRPMPPAPTPGPNSSAMYVEPIDSADDLVSQLSAESSPREQLGGALGGALGAAAYAPAPAVGGPRGGAGAGGTGAGGAGAGGAIDELLTTSENGERVDGYGGSGGSGGGYHLGGGGAHGWNGLGTPTASPNRKRERLAAAQAAGELLHSANGLGGTFAGVDDEDDEGAIADEIERRHAEAVGLFGRLFTRRCRHRDLVQAWACWPAFWGARSESLARLRAAASRILRREVHGAFRAWLEVWERLIDARAHAQMRQQAQSLSTQLRNAQFELGQQKLVRTARDDEIARLNEVLERASADAKRREADLAECHSALRGSHDLQQRLQAALDAAKVAASQRDEAETDVARERSKNQEMLKALLSEQHANFSREVADLRAQLRSLQEEEEERISELKEEMERELDMRVQAAKVDVLHQQAGRRMRYFQSFRSWQTWIDWCADRRYAMEQLQWAGTRLQALSMNSAFTAWAALWRAGDLEDPDAGALHAAANDEPPPVDPIVTRLLATEAQLGDAESVRRKLESELEAASAEVASERSAKQSLEDYVHRQLARHLRQSMMHHAFTAWIENWSARTWALGKLRHGIDRLFSKLNVIKAFEAWAQLSDLIQNKSVDKLNSRIEEAHAELEAQRREYERRLSEMAEEREMALSRQRVELEEASANEVAALEQQKRMERVEALKKRMVSLTPSPANRPLLCRHPAAALPPLWAAIIALETCHPRPRPRPPPPCLGRCAT